MIEFNVRKTFIKLNLVKGIEYNKKIVNSWAYL